MSIERTSSAGTALIRVGLILDSLAQPAWVEETLAASAVLERLHFVFTLVKGSPPGGGGTYKTEDRLATLLYRLYMRVDRRLSRADDNPFALRDVSDLLKGSSVCLVQPERTRWKDTIREEDVARLRAAAPDVVLHFGHRILAGPVLEAAPLGVWSLHHGDDRRFRGGPPAFWEVFLGEAAAGVVLQRLTPELDAGPIISRSVCATHRWSVFATRRRMYWAGVRLVTYALKTLVAVGPAEFTKRIEERSRGPRWYSRPLYRPPRNARMLGLLARQGGKAVARSWEKAFFREQWVLLWGRSAGPRTSPRSLKVIEPPRGTCWADPHAVVDGQGHTYVFFEEFASRGGKGRIALLVLDANGRRLDYRTVLEESWHLSYPFVFEWEGSRWLLPESTAQGRTTLYRAVEFPHRWEAHREILPGVRCYDPTLHRQGDRWWLFATVPSRAGLSSHQDLHLFHADRPDSACWTPHQENPVVSDVTRARPAGPLFEVGGKLYRPSQDCSRRYGYGVRINKVDLLDTNGYREREVGFIEPAWDPGLLGTHTFSFRPGVTVMDARRRFSW